MSFSQFQLERIGVELLPISLIRNWNSREVKVNWRVRAGSFLARTWPLSWAYVMLRIREGDSEWLYLPFWEVFPALCWEPYHIGNSQKSIRSTVRGFNFFSVDHSGPFSLHSSGHCFLPLACRLMQIRIERVNFRQEI